MGCCGWANPTSFPSVLSVLERCGTYKSLCPADAQDAEALFLWGEEESVLPSPGSLGRKFAAQIIPPFAQMKRRMSDSSDPSSSVWRQALAHREQEIGGRRFLTPIRHLDELAHMEGNASIQPSCSAKQQGHTGGGEAVACERSASSSPYDRWSSPLLPNPMSCCELLGRPRKGKLPRAPLCKLVRSMGAAVSRWANKEWENVREA
ncbi:Os05g0531300 [Oryza sativa Japonica Group]|uniref:Os05g0531300 protein n=1 Tax=Oryza sativa subsp. japonica TaxID=39947 RepID=A0A0P0WPT4_ORYSJ|nr:Os05g0531300 [Oryza sativa Japonica Group]